MRFLLAALLLLAPSAFAQSRISLLITVTNTATTSNTIVINGTTRTWTNASTSTTILTNLVSANGTKSNLFSQFSRWWTFAGPLNLVDVGTNSFKVVGTLGGSLTASISGTYAVLTLSTQSGTATYTALYPLENMSSMTDRVNEASSLVYGLGTYSTNAFATNSAAISNTLVKGASPLQRVLSPVLFDSVGGTNSGLTNGNITYANVNFASNISGRVTALTNGYFTNAVMDKPSTTNLINYGAIQGFATGGGQSFGTNITNAAGGVGVGKTVTVGESSTDIGFGIYDGGETNIAIGTRITIDSSVSNSMAIGNRLVISNSTGAAIGNDLNVTNDDVMIFGHGLTSIENDQMLLGGLSSVRVAGRLIVPDGITNLSVLDGTNVIRGDLSMPWASISTLANGNNVSVPFGTNVMIRLSGTLTSTGTICGAIGGATTGGRDGQLQLIWNDTGQIVEFTENTSDPIPANRFALYLSATVTLPDDSFAWIAYSSAASRWKVVGIYPGGTNSITGGGGGTNSSTVSAGQSITIVTNSGDYEVSVGKKDLFFSSTNRLMFSNGTAFVMSPTNDAVYLFKTNGSAATLLWSDGSTGGAGFQSGGGALLNAVTSYSNTVNLATLVARAIRLTNGAVNGYVLTSDATGLAAWAASTGGSGTNIGTLTSTNLQPVLVIISGDSQSTTNYAGAQKSWGHFLQVRNPWTNFVFTNMAVNFRTSSNNVSDFATRDGTLGILSNMTYHSAIWFGWYGYADLISGHSTNDIIRNLSNGMVMARSAGFNVVVPTIQQGGGSGYQTNTPRTILTTNRWAVNNWLRTTARTNQLYDTLIDIEAIFTNAGPVFLADLGDYYWDQFLTNWVEQITVAGDNTHFNAQAQAVVADHIASNVLRWATQPIGVHGGTIRGQVGLTVDGPFILPASAKRNAILKSDYLGYGSWGLPVSGGGPGGSNDFVPAGGIQFAITNTDGTIGSHNDSTNNFVYQRAINEMWVTNSGGTSNTVIGAGYIRARLLEVSNLNVSSLVVTNGIPAAGGSFEVQYNASGVLGASSSFRFLPSAYQVQVKNTTIGEVDILGEGFISQTVGGNAALAFGIGAHTNLIIDPNGGLTVRPFTGIGTNFFKIENTNGLPSLTVNTNGALSIGVDSGAAGMLAFGTNSGAISNVAAIKWNIWTNYVPTVSNFVFSFNTNRVELKNQTNVVFTNIVEEATAVGGDMTIHIHNTTGVTMGLVWPAYGAQHGYFFGTNINNPILISTTLTTGKHGVASLSCFGTNIFATWTEWP